MGALVVGHLALLGASISTNPFNLVWQVRTSVFTGQLHLQQDAAGPKGAPSMAAAGGAWHGRCTGEATQPAADGPQRAKHDAGAVQQPLKKSRALDLHARRHPLLPGPADTHHPLQHHQDGNGAAGDVAAGDRAGVRCQVCRQGAGHWPLGKSSGHTGCRLCLHSSPAASSLLDRGCLAVLGVPIRIDSVI